MKEKSYTVPAISVVVPVYNSEQFIKDCIDSILGQTFQDFELILIDDASTDSTWEICTQYSNNPHVRLYSHEMNRGSSVTKNEGRDYAIGKYIAYVDCDDFILPEYLEKLYFAAEKHKADVVRMGHIFFAWCEEQKIYAPAGKWVTFDHEAQLSFDIASRMEAFWKRAVPPMQWETLFLRDFLISSGIKFEDTFCDDILFHFAVLYYSKVYIFIPDMLYGFRLTPHSISRGADLEKSGKNLTSLINVMRYAKTYIQKMDKIKDDAVLLNKIYYNFFRIFLEGSYRASINGLRYDEVCSVNYEVFKKMMPNDAEFVSFLFEDFLQHHYDSLRN